MKIKAKVKIAVLVFAAVWFAAVVQILISEVSGRSSGITEAFAVNDNIVTESVKVNGYLDSLYTGEQCLNMADGMLKKLSAKKIAVHTDDNVCTVYGYSEKMHDHIYVNGNKINVQICFTKNELRGITEICVASPFNNEAY